MIYLLDTDTLVFFFRGQDNVTQRLLQVSAKDYAVSSITIAELYYGAYKAQHRQKRIEQVKALHASINIVPFAQQEARRFGELKASLEQQGQRLDDADVMIAATALLHGLILVTNNQRHFKRIPDLALENWV